MTEDDNELDKYIPQEDSHNKRRFRKLRHKALYLNIEYEDVFEDFQQAQQAFIAAMHQRCGQNNKPVPFAPAEKKPKEKRSEQELSEEEKLLYREIVMLTHPDKTSGLSEEEIAERSELYREAVEGKSSGNLGKLLSIAFKLDINVSDVSPEFIKSIEIETDKIQKKVDKMKSDIMYQWFYSSPEDQIIILDRLAGL